MCSPLPVASQRFGDMAWRVPRRGGGAEVVVLVEFQSTVDQDMGLSCEGQAPRAPRRMRDYRRLAWERLAERGNGPPALLPVVLYNGSDGWTAPGAATALAEWSLASQLTLAPFQGWDYVLLSLEWLRSSGGLASLPLVNRSAATLRLQAERMPAELLARFRREWARFAGDAEAETRSVLYAWTSALLADMGGAESALPPLAELEGLKEERTWQRYRRRCSTSGSREFAPSMWPKAWNAASSGSVRTVLARLRRQAAIKFGARTAERLAVLLGAAVAHERMARLSDRVSDWIVECERGEDLLSRVSALVGNGDAES